jgi:hypothetical protein
MIPPAVFSCSAMRRTSTRSCNGVIFTAIFDFPPIQLWGESASLEVLAAWAAN